MKSLLFSTFCALLLCGCEKREVTTAEVVTVEVLAETVPILSSVPSMADLKAARVVAYRFATPNDGPADLPMESGFSLITDGGLDLATLEKLKIAEATLTSGQVLRLVDAVYGPHKKFGPAACYTPHHLFLFHDSADTLIQAIEVCFGCINLHAQPDVGEPQWARHDFRELARLCDEIGIGVGSGTAEEQIRIWDERDKL
jgi:hypothetical protein